MKSLKPVGILLLAVSAVACSQVTPPDSAVANSPKPTPATTKPPTNTPATTKPPTTTQAGGYKTVPVQEFLASYKISPLEPKTAALAVFSDLTKEAEALKSGHVEIDESTAQKAVATVSVIGLGDDSVRGMRYRLKFDKSGGTWKLLEVGTQTQCQPGRGHQDWAGEACS